MGREGGGQQELFLLLILKAGVPGKYSTFPDSSGSKSVVLRWAVSTSSGNWLEVHILRLLPRPADRAQ